MTNGTLSRFFPAFPLWLPFVALDWFYWWRQSLTKFQFTSEIKSHQYEYTSNIASKSFYFAPAISNLNFSEYLSDPQTCQCKKCKFCYEPHGHVINGDLRVIENAKLRELVAKGPKYREPNKVNWKATETMFLKSIDLYAKKLVQKRTGRTQISV